MPALENLDGVGRLGRLEEMYVSWGLQSLAGLEELEDLSIFLMHRSSVVSIPPLRVTKMETITITNNSRLTSLSGLHGLREVSQLVITGNPKLPETEIQALIEAIGPENIGSLVAEDNAP